MLYGLVKDVLQKNKKANLAAAFQNFVKIFSLLPQTSELGWEFCSNPFQILGSELEPTHRMSTSKTSLDRLLIPTNPVGVASRGKLPRPNTARNSVVAFHDNTPCTLLSFFTLPYWAVFVTLTSWQLFRKNTPTVLKYLSVKNALQKDSPARLPGSLKVNYSLSQKVSDTIFPQTTRNYTIILKI